MLSKVKSGALTVAMISVFASTETNASVHGWSPILTQTEASEPLGTPTTAAPWNTLTSLTYSVIAGNPQVVTCNFPGYGTLSFKEVFDPPCSPVSLLYRYYPLYGSGTTNAP